jgi:CBS domain-containing protein
VVVVDEAGAAVGVVSRRDIFHGALSWSLGQGRAGHDKLLRSCPVKQVMASTVVTTTPDAKLADAAERMMQEKLGCLPVVDADDLVGILTEGDFLALLTASQAEAED